MFKKILCAALLACAAVSAQASNLPDYPFIHTGGSSASYVMPDTGQIDFEISAYDADPAMALATVETRAREIRALATEHGVATEDLEIRDVRREFRKFEAGASPNAIIHDLRIGVRINVRDLTRWQAIAGPLVAMPNLDGFMTTFENSGREKFERELVSAAIKDARARAQHIAAGLGRQLGPVSAVSHGDLKNLTRAMGLAPSDFSYREPRRGNMAAASVLIVGLLKFSQSVDVIFRLK